MAIITLNLDDTKPTEKVKAASKTVKKKKSNAADLGNGFFIKNVPVKKISHKEMPSNRNEKLMKRVNSFAALNENKVLLLHFSRLT